METSFLIGSAVGIGGALAGRLFGGKLTAPLLPDVLYVAIVLVLFLVFAYFMAFEMLLPGGVMLGLVLGAAAIKLLWKKKH